MCYTIIIKGREKHSKGKQKQLRAQKRIWRLALKISKKFEIPLDKLQKYDIIKIQKRKEITSMKSNDMITYKLSNGVTITATRAYINQLRREQADRAREIAAKNAPPKR